MKVVCMILLSFMLTSCANVSAGEFTRFSSDEIADMLSDVPPYLLDFLGLDKATVTNNPLGAPLFFPDDERAWDFALAAAVPGHEIYLYWVEDISVVYINGQVLRFDNWAPLFGGRIVYPQMLYHDLNGDSGKELAIIIPSGSGTGLSLNNLHVLSFDESENYRHHHLRGWDVNDWFDIPLEFETIEGESAFRFNIFGESFVIDIFNDEFSTPLQGIGVGNIVNFWFDGTDIIVYIAVEKHYEGWTPVFFGGLQGKVMFDGEDFWIEWCKFQDYVL